MKKVKEFLIKVKNKLAHLLELSFNFEKIINGVFLLAIFTLMVLAIVFGLVKPLFVGDFVALERVMDVDLNTSISGMFKFTNVLDEMFEGGYYHSLSSFDTTVKEVVINMSNSVSTIRLLTIFVLIAEGLYMVLLGQTIFDGSDIIASALVIGMLIFYSTYTISSFQAVSIFTGVSKNFVSIIVFWGVIFILSLLKYLYNTAKNKHNKVVVNQESK